MIRKMIDVATATFILSSTVLVIPAAIHNPKGAAFAAWATLVYLAGLWQLYRYQTDDGPLLKMPRPNGNSGQGHKRKFYNIIISENIRCIRRIEGRREHE